MLNDDYKVIGFTCLSTLYLIFTYGGNFLIPIISFMIYSFLKVMAKYYNVLEYIKFEREDKVAYEIYEQTGIFVVPLFFFTMFACIFNFYHLQLFITTLLLIDKYTEYVMVHIDLDIFYLNNYYLTGTVLISSLLLTIHANQIEQSNYILNIFAFIGHNALVSITYNNRVIDEIRLAPTY